MPTPQSLDAMTEDQLLDFADTCAEAARKAEVDLLRVAYQWAVVHSADRLDPAETGEPQEPVVRAYEIPDRHRAAVRLMTPADVFPHAASLSRSTQIDHTVPWDRTGHHRTKTHGAWQVQQPFPGVYLWRDPHGGFHLVDHTGTRYLRPSPITIDFVAA